MLSSSNPIHFSQDNLKKTGLTNELCMTTSFFFFFFGYYHHNREPSREEYLVTALQSQGRSILFETAPERLSEHKPVTTLETQFLP